MYISQFLQLLELRRNIRRQNDKEDILKDISYLIVHIYCLSENSLEFKQLLDNEMEYILKDCDIYYGMTREKAIDSLKELSYLSSIYCIDKKSTFYYEIKKLIGSIISTYNLNNIL
jgi:hypothetical protein